MFFADKNVYAVCLKAYNIAIGCIERKLNGHTDMTERDDECELGLLDWKRVLRTGNDSRSFGRVDSSWV